MWRAGETRAETAQVSLGPSGHTGCEEGGPASEEADGPALSFGARITDILSPGRQATDSPDPSSLLSMSSEVGGNVVQWLGLRPGFRQTEASDFPCVQWG